MSSLVAIGLCLLSAFEVGVSPDQPLPYSYLDDPLIVEIRSDTACTVDIHLTATPPYDQPPREARFDDVALSLDASRWCAIKDMSTLRGPWSLTIAITTESGEETISKVAYRIDRPGERNSHALYAYGDVIDRNTLLALRSVGVNTVQVPLSHPELPALLDTLRTLDMRVLLHLPARAEELETARTLGETYCDVLVGWSLEGSFSPQTTVNALQTLRSIMCQVPIHVTLPRGQLSEEELQAATQGNRMQFKGTPEALTELRESLAVHGLDAREIDVLLPRDVTAAPNRFMPLYHEYRAQGARAIAFPIELIYAENTLQPGLAHINGLMHRIPPTIPAGRIPQPGTSRLQVFSGGDRWIATAWRNDDTSTLELPWSNAHPFSLMDIWGNGLDNTPGESTWTNPLSQGFLYISGRSGPILRTALIQRVKEEARAALKSKTMETPWANTLKKTLTTIAADPAGVSSRVEFFTLLRAFPDLEERWHAGQLTRPVALTTLAQLAALARTLCQLEGALGSSFLEPLQDTLARCEEFQSVYLTGSTDTEQARARGDWLVAEVRRLMDEAESLALADQRIEADAVAALAEWRARGLVFAVKAGPTSDRLTLPEPELKVEQAPKSTNEKKKPSRKKK